MPCFKVALLRCRQARCRLLLGRPLLLLRKSWIRFEVRFTQVRLNALIPLSDRLNVERDRRNSNISTLQELYTIKMGQLLYGVLTRIKGVDIKWEYVFWLFFKVDIFSATSLESYCRDFLKYMAEHET